MCCAVTQILALFLLICSINHGDQSCLHYNRSQSVCESLDDLYEKQNLRPDVWIVKEDKYSDLEDFRSLPLEKARNIERLTIKAAINNINKDAFANFINIQFLIFENDKLEEISVGIFRNLNVKWLSFYNCGIKVIAPGAFTNLTKLENILFRHNNLTRISVNIFNNLTANHVILSNNQISDIEEFSFGNMSNLTGLLLDNNRLTKFILQENLHYPENLEKLWLHNNELTEVTVYMLEGLTNLKILNLMFNSISFIEPGSFEGTPKLKILVLSHNNLKTITGDVFPKIGLNELQKLYLDHNRLTYMSSNSLFRLNTLKEISLAGNPWQCPCLNLVLRWLYDNDVRMACDKDYFRGKRPICVVPDNNECRYYYNEKHYELYRSQIAAYPPRPLCVSD